MQFEKLRQKMAVRGIVAARPSDLLKPDEWVRLTNCRSDVDGTIRTRKGLTLLYDIDAGATAACHSISRLNDPVNNRSTYFTGAGTKLYADDSGHTAATEIDSGYRGDPLSIVIHRPDQSPLPFAYFADRSRMRKAKSTAAADTFKSYPIGIAPPLVPPTVSLDAPLVKVVDDFQATTGWGQAGDAGAPALLAGRRVDTTIAQILFDVGTTGFACVNPTALTAQLQAGMRLLINSGGGTAETVLVEAVYPAITSTTISSIKYDGSTSGPCTIVLTNPSATLVKDSMIRIAAAENVRVISVTVGPQGVTSFRCSTTATRSAGDAVAGLASFRASFVNTHATTETLRAEAVESVITFSSGTGTLTKTSALDLSISGTRPITNDDMMCLSFRASLPSAITEIQVQLDCADATNDFTKDYFTRSFRADDLTASVRGTTPTLTVTQRAIQREQIDNFGGTRTIERGFTPEPDISGFRDTLPEITGEPTDPSGGTQLGLGDSVWTTLQWKLIDMERVGQDSSRGWKNIAAIRIKIICTASVTIDLDSWYIRGSYGLDVQGAKWAYRYRSLETKARSLLSPPTRSPLDVTRGSVTVNCTTKDTTTAGDPQVTAIDIYRFDDVLEDWSLVGTVANPANAAATTANFADEFSDEFVKDNPLAEWDQFQPWPIPDQPRSGVVDVVGTEVTRVSGDNFNIAWARGGRMKVNGTPCTLYSSPTSTSRFSLNENLGTLTNAKLEFPEPLLLGQPKAILFGPYGAGSVGIFFFSVDGGTLIWTNPNNPDAAADSNRLEITSPSEPLVNGFMYDGRPYVFSSERLFGVFPTQRSDGSFGFVAQEVANCEGLYATWGVTVADGGLIYFVGEDGIYESESGESRSISTDLSPLFPHDGNVGTDSEYVAPDFSAPNALRLSHCDNRVRVVYFVSGTYRCFVWNTVTRCWESNDLHTPNATVFYTEDGAGIHGELVGTSNGKLYRYAGSDDAGIAIAASIKSAAFDCGRNNRKLFHDFQFDIDTDGNNVALTVAKDSFQTAVTPAPATLNNSDRAPVLVNLEAGAGTEARNLGFTLSWTDADVVLYEFILSYFPRPTDALSFLLPEATFGARDYFSAKEYWIAHESDSDLTLTTFIDGVQTDYTIANGGGAYRKTRVLLEARKGKSIKTLITGDASARIHPDDCELLVRVWGDTGPYSSVKPLMEPQIGGQQ